MLLLTCILETGAEPALFQADDLDYDRLDGVHQREMPNVPSASSRKNTLSGMIPLYIQISDGRTCITFGVVRKPVVPVL